MPGAIAQHKCTLFQPFPARTQRQTGRLHTASHKRRDMHAISIRGKGEGNVLGDMGMLSSDASCLWWNFNIFAKDWKVTSFKITKCI